MGIHQAPLDMIRALSLPRGFTVCELGDQWVTTGHPHYLAVEFYKSLGCKRYVSIDGNARGTVTADLNHPLSMKLGSFTLVTDFGTGEHVFDQSQVWKTIHLLTKPDGYIAFDRPMHGYEGHCFYRADFSLFKDLAEANKYDVITLERRTTIRGEMAYGVFKRTGLRKFQIPQQGRYRKLLRPITT